MAADADAVHQDSAVENTDSRRLFVGGLSLSTSRETLKDYFLQYGLITDAIVMNDKNTGRSRGFGFVVFENVADADRIMQERANHIIDEKQVQVDYSMPSNDFRRMKDSLHIGGIPLGWDEESIRQMHTDAGADPALIRGVFPLKGRSGDERDQTSIAAIVQYDSPETAAATLDLINGFSVTIGDTWDTSNLVVRFCNAGGKSVEKPAIEAPLLYPVWLPYQPLWETTLDSHGWLPYQPHWETKLDSQGWLPYQPLSETTPDGDADTKCHSCGHWQVAKKFCRMCGVQLAKVIPPPQSQKPPREPGVYTPPAPVSPVKLEEERRKDLELRNQRLDAIRKERGKRAQASRCKGSTAPNIAENPEPDTSNMTMDELEQELAKEAKLEQLRETLANLQEKKGEILGKLQQCTNLQEQKGEILRKLQQSLETPESRGASSQARSDDSTWQISDSTIYIGNLTPSESTVRRLVDELIHLGGVLRWMVAQQVLVHGAKPLHDYYKGGIFCEYSCKQEADMVKATLQGRSFDGQDVYVADGRAAVRMLPYLSAYKPVPKPPSTVPPARQVKPPHLKVPKQPPGPPPNVKKFPKQPPGPSFKKTPKEPPVAPPEILEHLKVKMIEYNGTSEFTCKYGWDCKRWDCTGKHPQGRNIVQNPASVICKLRRNCTGECFLVHPLGRIADEVPKGAVKIDNFPETWKSEGNDAMARRIAIHLEVFGELLGLPQVSEDLSSAAASFSEAEAAAEAAETLDGEVFSLALKHKDLPEDKRVLWTIRIGHINPAVTEAELRHFCEEAGAVHACRIHGGKETEGQQNEYVHGYCDYYDKCTQQMAIEVLNGKELEGIPVKVRAELKVTQHAVVSGLLDKLSTFDNADLKLLVEEGAKVIGPLAEPPEVVSWQRQAEDGEADKLRVRVEFVGMPLLMKRSLEVEGCTLEVSPCLASKRESHVGESQRERTIFVANLSLEVPAETLVEQLRRLFSEVGQVEDLRVPMHDDGDKIQGVAFCQFASTELAEVAAERLNGINFHNKHLHVGRDRGKEEHNITADFFAALACGTSDTTSSDNTAAIQQELLARSRSRSPKNDNRHANRPDDELVSITIHVDELQMLSRPIVEPSSEDCEVWVDPLPEEDSEDWVGKFGEVLEVFRLDGTELGREGSRGYVKFIEHESARRCVAAGIGVWSESERILASARPKPHRPGSVIYPTNVVRLLIGSQGTNMKKLASDVGGLAFLGLRGEAPGVDFLSKGEEMKSSRLHLSCKGVVSNIEKVQQAFEQLLFTAHVIVFDAIGKEKKSRDAEKENARDAQERARECTVFIGNLSADIEHEDLHSELITLCSEVGTVESLRFSRSLGNKPKCVFCEFMNPKAAQEAIVRLHEKEFQGSRLRVQAYRLQDYRHGDKRHRERSCSHKRSRSRRRRPSRSESPRRKSRDDCKVCIANLNLHSREEDVRHDLRKICQGVGTVEDINIPWDKTTNRNKGFAFCRFSNSDAVEVAIRRLDDVVEMHGKRLRFLPYQRDAISDRSRSRSHELDRTSRNRSDDCKVHIGNLNLDSSEKDLRDDLQRLCSDIGTIENIGIPWDIETQRHRGFAFCQFRNPEAAEEAVSRLDGTDLHGRHLRVEPYQKDNRKRRRRDRRDGDDAKLVFASIHIDELQMPLRPDIEPAPTDCEVWADQLPDEESETWLKRWRELFGEVVEVYRIDDIGTGESGDKGYVRFEDHESAKRCVDTGIAVWSESERCLSSKHHLDCSTYPKDMLKLLMGKGRRNMSALVGDLGLRFLSWRGDGLNNPPSDHETSSSRLHVACHGSSEAVAKVQPALQQLLQDAHQEVSNAGLQLGAYVDDVVRTPSSDDEEMSDEQESYTFEGRPDGSKVPLEENRSDASEFTTIMLRKIPNSYTRDMLLALLDSRGFCGRYDFVYLPFNIQKDVNIGYAFVNAMTHQDALYFMKRLQGFAEWASDSKKACEVTWAPIFQGLRANVERWCKSPMTDACIPDEYKPMIFSHDGKRVPIPLPKLGNRIGRQKSRSRSPAKPSKIVLPSRYSRPQNFDTPKATETEFESWAVGREKDVAAIKEMEHYRLFIETVPPDQRGIEAPRTPDPSDASVSTRAWKWSLEKWRLQVKSYVSALNHVTSEPEIYPEMAPEEDRMRSEIMHDKRPSDDGSPVHKESRLEQVEAAVKEIEAARQAVAGDWLCTRNGKELRYKIHFNNDDQCVLEQRATGVEGILSNIGDWWQGDVKVGMVRVKVQGNGTLFSQFRLKSESIWGLPVIGCRQCKWQIPDVQTMESQVVVTFQPGPIGISEHDGCTISGVLEGGQAQQLGLRKGWKIVAVGGRKCESFKDQMFQDAKCSSAPFDVAFEKDIFSVWHDPRHVGVAYTEDDNTVTNVKENSPASRAGVKVGMKMSALNGTPFDHNLLQALVSGTEKFEITYSRNTQANEATVAFQPEPVRIQANETTVTFQPGPVGIVAPDGCVVMQVQEGGQSEKLGIKPGWRIIMLGSQQCRSFRDRMFQDAKRGSVPYQVTFVKADETKTPAVDENAKNLEVAKNDVEDKFNVWHDPGLVGVLYNPTDHTVLNVKENSPAFHAGVKIGMKMLALNGNAFTHTRLQALVNGKQRFEITYSRNQQVANSLKALSSFWMHFQHKKKEDERRMFFDAMRKQQEDAMRKRQEERTQAELLQRFHKMQVEQQRQSNTSSQNIASGIWENDAEVDQIEMGDAYENARVYEADMFSGLWQIQYESLSVVIHYELKVMQNGTDVRGRAKLENSSKWKTIVQGTLQEGGPDKGRLFTWSEFINGKKVGMFQCSTQGGRMSTGYGQLATGTQLRFDGAKVMAFPSTTSSTSSEKLSGIWEEQEVVWCECGQKIEEDDTFCGNCGKKRQVEDASNEVANEEAATCLSCGQEFLEDDTFCPECGAKREEAPETIAISGATGPYGALVNGHYEQWQGVRRNGKPCWRKNSDETKLLEWLPIGWLVTNNRSDGVCWLWSCCGGKAALPTDVKAWKVFDGEGMKYQVVKAEKIQVDEQPQSLLPKMPKSKAAPKQAKPLIFLEADDNAKVAIEASTEECNSVTQVDLCPACNTAFEADDAFCGECGAARQRVEGDDENICNEESQDEEANARTTLWCVYERSIPAEFLYELRFLQDGRVIGKGRTKDSKEWMSTLEGTLDEQLGCLEWSEYMNDEKVGSFACTFRNEALSEGKGELTNGALLQFDGTKIGDRTCGELDYQGRLANAWTCQACGDVQVPENQECSRCWTPRSLDGTADSLDPEGEELDPEEAPEEEEDEVDTSLQLPDEHSMDLPNSPTLGDTADGEEPAAKRSLLML